jgi:4-amino-4-deoxy-L-arabinose transferase-like glycosyltransferase
MASSPYADDQAVSLSEEVRPPWTREDQTGVSPPVVQDHSSKVRQSLVEQPPGAEIASRTAEGPPWLALGVLTLLALCLRVIGLNAGLWYDEVVTLVESVRPSLWEVLTEYHWNNKHPLYSLLGHWAIGLFGEHAWSLRLPALLFGVACVPMLHVLASRITSQREALFATALLTVSYHHAWFSQNARGYTALAFWTLLATYCLLRGLREARLGFFVGYGFAAALGVYTHLTMVFVVAGHALIAAASWAGLFQGETRVRGWRQPALGFGLAGGLSLLLYAPLLLQVQQFFGKPPDPLGAAVATPQWALWETLRGLKISLGSFAPVLVALVVFAVGLWSYGRQSRLVLALFLLPGAITAGVALGMQRPIFPRFFFFLIGFAVLILVRGALSLPGWVAWRPAQRDRREWGLGVGLVVIVLILFASAYTCVRGAGAPKQDYEQAMHFIEANRQAGEPVLTVGLATYAYQKYYARPWVWVETLEQLQAVQARHRRTWLVYTFPAYLERQAPALMAAIRRDYQPVQVFPGTVGGGDVVVCGAEFGGPP